MSRRFVAAAGEIEIGVRVIVDAAQSVEPFVREGHTPFGGGGGGEEQMLARDEGAQFLIECRIKLGHCYNTPFDGYTVILGEARVLVQIPRRRARRLSCRTGRGARRNTRR